MHAGCVTVTLMIVIPPVDTVVRGETDTTMGPTAITPELSDEEWKARRNATTQRFFGIEADEFLRRFEAGEFADDSVDGLMQTLMIFPELR